jgi:uncharacterized protein YtpQ (UPF0354 family)
MSYLSKININVNEKWLSISNSEYEISTTTAIIRNVNTHELLSVWNHKAAVRYYVKCKLGLVHRVMMSALLSRDLLTREQVRHINGNPFDNSLDNLIIGNAKSNALDKIATNTNGHKLKNQDVRDIRRITTRSNIKLVARRYKITVGHIRNILAGRSWYNLPTC